VRYIDIEAVIESIPKGVRDALKVIDDSMPGKSDAEKADAWAGGNLHWTPVKVHLENASNRKCWYTESKNPGCLNDVEHFRPKARVEDKQGALEYWYWFLAFDPTNYRLSCQFPNRLNANAVLGATGGKGNKFPLLPASARAIDKAGVAGEKPVLLDPCVQSDTELLEFLPDGRPVLSPRFHGDLVAAERVETSNLLLNLDFSTFNEDREQLYNKVKKLVERGDRYLAARSASIAAVQEDLLALIHPDEEYSKAAECYIRCFRDRKWVEELILP